MRVLGARSIGVATVSEGMDRHRPGRAKRWSARAAIVAAFALLPAAAASPVTSAQSCVRASDALAGRGMDVTPRDLEIAVGQMLLVGMAGAGAGEGTVEATREAIAQGTLGGVLLLRRNLGTPADIRLLVAQLHPRGAPVKPFLAVDQEGGRVQRLREEQGVASMPSAAALAVEGEAEARAVYARNAEALAAYGINVNFGPVVDLDRERDNPIIGGMGRAYGTEPDAVTRLARTFLDAHRDRGIATAIKHFPGHGSSLADTHEGFTDITGSWDEVELEPFAALLDEADMVMSAHLFHERFAGPDGVPASLSPLAVDDLLREEMGYRGVVVTDDLDMGAIAEHYGFEDAVVRAVAAGNDILLFSRPTRREGFVPDLARRAICDAVADGRLDGARIAESATRVLTLKRERGLMVENG